MTNYSELLRDLIEHYWVITTFPLPTVYVLNGLEDPMREDEDSIGIFTDCDATIYYGARHSTVNVKMALNVMKDTEASPEVDVYSRFSTMQDELIRVINSQKNYLIQNTSTWALINSTAIDNIEIKAEKIGFEGSFIQSVVEFNFKVVTRQDG